MADEDDRTNPGEPTQEPPTQETPAQETSSNPILDEFDREIENQRTEVEDLVNGGDGNSSQQPEPQQQDSQQQDTQQQDNNRQDNNRQDNNRQDNNRQDNNRQDNNRQDNNRRENAQPQRPGELGVSSAYADMNLGAPTSSPKTRQAPTPPKRPEKDKDKDYKDIMDLFWKEIVLASYSYVIDKATDLTMDFVDYVLYDRNNDADKKSQLDHYTIARGIRDKECEKSDKKVDAATARLAEFINNLEKVKNGEEPSWDINKKKPQSFDEASRIYNKPENERTSDEKLFIEGIFNSVNNIKELGNAEKKLISIAAGCAAEKVRNDDMNGDVISSKFTESMKKIEEELSKDTPNKSIITTHIGLASKEVDSDCEVHKSISAKLGAIQEAVNGDDLKTVKKGIKDIHQIEEENANNPHFRQMKIAKATQENISAIRAEEDRLIASGQQHTVSKEFTESLRSVNQTVASNVLTEDEKKAKLTELTTSMKDMLTTNTPEQNVMREQLTQMGEKLQNGDMNISENLENINKTHAENLPIHKFTQQLVTNAETLKEANNERKGFKGMYKSGDKKAKAKDDANKLEESFKRNEAKATVSPSARTFEENLFFAKNRNGR